MTRLLSLLALATVLTACGDDSGGGGPRVCDPGATQRCVCADGMGVQVCGDDGARWLSCACGPAADGGGGHDGSPGEDAGQVAGDGGTGADAGGGRDAAAALDAAAPTGDASPPEAGPPVDAAAADGGGREGGAGDASVPPGSCAVPLVPNHETRITTTSAFYASRFPQVLVAGGTVFTLGPFDGWRRWYRWSGTDWVPEDVPWPTSISVVSVDRVVPLDDGTVALLVGTDAAGSCWPSPCAAALLRFDGTRFDAPVPLDEAWALYQKAFTRTADGRWHVLVRAAGEPWTLRSGDASGFGMPAPAPVPAGVRDDGEVALVALGDALVLAYVNTHAFRIHRAPGADWSEPVDLTPEWAVGISGLQLVPARDGGVLLGMTGVSTSYRFPFLLRSADGVAFDAGEYLDRGLDDALLDLDAACLDTPVALLHGGYRVGPKLHFRDGFEAWRQVDGPPGWPNGGGSAVVLPDGRVFWAFQQNDEAVTEFSVTLRATRP